ncbi:ATP-binding cassette domain-containing protein [Klebsiella pneumoniae]
MSVEEQPEATTRSYKLNALFFRRLYTLSAPYWCRREAWKAWAIMAMQLSSAAAFSLVGGYLSNLVADSTNALVAKQSIYWRIMIWMTFVGLMQTLAMQVTSWFSAWLLLDWRKWMTRHLLHAYMQNRTYYEIEKDGFIDNPDQRLQEEVPSVCQTVLGIPQFILSSLMTIAVQASIIVQVSPGMFWAVVIYAGVNTLVSMWLYNPTIRQSWDLTVAQARMRTGLMHLRDNAETIAFYRGENSERKGLHQRLRDVARVKMTMIFYGIRMSVVNQVMGLIFSLLPIFFVVPLYFSGKVAYGSIDQVGAAAAMVLSGLSVISNFIPTMTSTMPSVVRLSEIQEKFNQLNDPQSARASTRIHHHEGESISLKQVDVATPGGEQQLVRNLSLHVAEGQHTLIVGQTGVGKSSLLRAIAGLWQRGQGEIQLPPYQQLMFIPQKPYMILTDLRSQLLYPEPAENGDDMRIQQVFSRLGRPDFLARQGGLDCIKDWRKVLSLGEQQLVAFARILLRQPRYVFLDEATSAMDVETERQAYRALGEANITCISVGHRETLMQFHPQKLQLLAHGEWRLTQHGEEASQGADAALYHLQARAV